MFEPIRAKPFASVNIQKAEGNDEESIEVSPAEPPLVSFPIDFDYFYIDEQSQTPTR